MLLNGIDGIEQAQLGDIARTQAVVSRVHLAYKNKNHTWLVLALHTQHFVDTKTGSKAEPQKQQQQQHTQSMQTRVT